MEAIHTENVLPEVMSKIAGLGPTGLKAVHSFLLNLELAALSAEIRDDADILEAAGKLDARLVEDAITEHRARQPYR